MRFAPPPGATVDVPLARASSSSIPSEFGFEFLPIKRLGLAAASGTTPFDGLFLGFSLFIMVSALMLVALLFRLGVEAAGRRKSACSASRRAASPQDRRRAGAAKALVVAAMGSLVGRGGRRRLCLADARGAEHLVAGGDQHAVSRTVRHADEPARRLCQRRDRVAADDRLDAAAAQAFARAAAAWRARRRDRFAHATTRSARRVRASPGPWPRWPWRSALSALRLGGEAQAGAFVGSGALVLAAALDAASGAHLRSGDDASLLAAQSLADRAAGGAQWRAQSGPQHAVDRADRGGQFSDRGAERLSARSGRRGTRPATAAAADSPCRPKRSADLSGSEHAGRPRPSWACPPRPSEVLEQCHDGGAARASRRRRQLLESVSAHAAARAGRAATTWSSAAASPGPAARARRRRGAANPWLLLEQAARRTADGTPVVPVVLDFNTAKYSLHKGRRRHVRHRRRPRPRPCA